MVSWDTAYSIASWADALILLLWGAIDLSKGHRRDGCFLLAIGVLASAISSTSHYKERSLTLQIENARTAGLDAALQVESLRKNNLELQTALEQERSHRLQIEAQLAPRILTHVQQSQLTASLERFSGHPLKVMLQADPEARAYGESLMQALQRAGWNVNIQSSGGRVERYGLLVGGPDASSNALKALVNELVKCGNPVLFVKMASGQDEVLEVYLRPPFGLSPRLMVDAFEPRGWTLPLNWSK